MSVKVSTWAWQCARERLARGNELLVLLALADVANDNGVCIYVPGEEATQKALAAKCAMSESTFRRSLRNLEESGLLDVARESSITINKYSLLCTGQSDRCIATVTPVNSDRSDRSTVTGHRERIYVEEEAALLPREEVEQKSRRKKPERALPAGWCPTPVHAEKARALGLDLSAEEESFRLHAEAHDRRAASWNAAFTMWLSKAAGFRGAGVAPAVPNVRTSLSAERVLWLRDRRVSVEEYEERKNEPGWLESLEKMEAVNA